MLETFRWRHLVSWVFAGAVVAPLLAWGLSELAKALNSPVGSNMAPRQATFWMMAPAGAATAFVLNLIHRAFAHPAQ